MKRKLLLMPFKLNFQKIGVASFLLMFQIGFSQQGAALDFDGTNDYVSCGNILPLSYTKEAWIYVKSLNSQNNIISGGDSDGLHAFWIPNSSGKLSAGHNGDWFALEDTVPLSVNTWHHVAVTYDAATTTLKLYKDGALIDTSNDVGPVDGGNMVRLGAFNNAANSFTGTMDEVRIWNRALSPSEITSTMNCELPDPVAGLVAYYKFNQGIANANNASVTTLQDSSGNNYNGTLNGFSLNGNSSNWVDNSVINTGTVCTTYLNVSSVEKTTNFKFFPNPATNKLFLTSQQPILDVEVIDFLGQTVIRQKVSSVEAEINLSSLTPASYLIRVKTEKGLETIKVIKK
ncbi:LamG-like jellyroll fold domain-containing protein [Chryseobacterium sp. ON_d1]|uniref:LamG-like jellyroll fold domain-containing protein n=1 Tax=Chryseobacterium sp. ON_d1 TaxID=2583211 RepID=UPI00115B4194|nr:LamG-like jellyroll fold domain-containing protein [Chryseobacterium sp. ON_d1]